MGEAMAATFPVYDQNHNEVGKVELPDKVFGVESRPHIVHQVVKMYLANQRMGTAAVKNKAKVRGGGKKPWRQKGTGRARSGSIRSPLWKGGGSIFGPQVKDYWSRIPKNMRNESLKVVLTDRADEGNIVVLDSLSIPDGKTRSFNAFINKMELKKALIVVEGLDEKTIRATRNVQGYKVMDWRNLNSYEVLKYPVLVLTKTALSHISERLS